MLTVINISVLHTQGIKDNSIFAVATYLNTVTAASLDLLGGVFLTISAVNNITGETRQTNPSAMSPRRSQASTSLKWHVRHWAVSLPPSPLLLIVTSPALSQRH